MKFLLTRASLLALVAALVVGSTGCSKKPVGVTPLPAGRSGSTAPTGAVPMDGTGSGTGRLNDGTGAGARDVSGTDLTGGQKGLSDLSLTDQAQDRTTLAADTIYFDFDKSNVKAQYNSNIKNVADYLAAHPGTSLLIEGHTDNRGTEEYNRALGERRALSVREKLLASGVNTDRLATVSFGEEKPAALGDTDADHAKNRRAEFVLLTPNAGAVR
jgi:peptidoglycan-associated lipoprotein